MRTGLKVTPENTTDTLASIGIARSIYIPHSPPSGGAIPVEGGPGSFDQPQGSQRKDQFRVKGDGEFPQWGEGRDLNPQPLEPQSSALPVELPTPYVRAVVLYRRRALVSRSILQSLCRLLFSTFPAIRLSQGLQWGGWTYGTLTTFATALGVLTTQMVPRDGIEPPTRRASTCRSTTELPRHIVRFWPDRKLEYWQVLCLCRGSAIL